jgi:tetratricopeptide (TPR) repeat protein
MQVFAADVKDKSHGTNMQSLSERETRWIGHITKNSNNVQCEQSQNARVALKDSVDLFRSVLEMHRKEFGHDHLKTLKSMEFLAIVLNVSCDRYEEAEELFREILELRCRTQGPEHTDTLNNMDDLALTLRKQGRYDEAEKLYRETLCLRCSTQGPKHPETFYTTNNLFSLHCLINKTESALSELSELLKHPNYIQGSINSLTGGCIVLAATSPEIARSIAEAIDESTSKELLYPLRAGLGLYLGEKMCLPREVREIAKIISERIKEQKLQL